MNAEMKIIYNMTLNSREFSLIKNILKNSGSPKAVALAEELESRQKTQFEEIAKNFKVSIESKEIA